MAFTSYKLATIKTDVDITLPTQQNVVNEEALRNKLQSLDLYSVMQKFGLSQEKQQEEIKPQLKTTNVLSVSELPQDEYTFVLYSKEQVRILSKDKQYITDNIKSVLEYLSDKKIVTHKAKELYKQFIISNIKQYDICFDTEIASYLLNPDLKVYNIKELSNQEDEMCGLVTLFSEYKSKLKSTGMEKLFFEIEMPLCEVLADMELTGVKIDKQGVEHFGEKLKAEIDSLVKEIHILADEQFNINSTKELGAILFEKLKLPAKKKTKTGYSTGAEVLEELVGIHPIIELVLKYRQLAKLHSTYVIGLLKVIAEDGRIHSTFNQTETRTGRISSTEPNMQNIPIRTPLGSEMRKFFVAESGYSLIDADYSQIELRLLAHIADDKVMIKAFKDGADIHSTTAAEVFNVETPTQEQRSRAKAINFGIVYGIGAFSLSKDINVSVKEAKEYIEAYLQTYTGVKNYMEQVVKDAEYNGYVTTLYGRRRYLPDINAKNKMLKAFSARVALNAPIQGTAADIIKLAMIKVYKRIKKENLDAKLILQVHDELIIEAPLMQQDYVKKILKEEMENASDIFLVADVNSGENWFLAH
ncbi:MAG: DNA polymerase, partial [Oscillospiraceae bacterium]